MALGHLLYISDAICPVSQADLDAIHDVSTRNNAEHGITGVLLYSAGHFVQLLEGAPADIRRLFEKISRDPRHRHLRLLVEHRSDKRVFSDWAMGVLDLDHCDEEHRQSLDELVRMAGTGQTSKDGTPIELEILSRFCMLLPAP